MAITEHFYPGIFGGTASLETHARFIGQDLGERRALLDQWQVPYYVGEFNVVFDSAGGADMMRRYFDIFKEHGWAATLWSYKLVKRDGRCPAGPLGIWLRIIDALDIPDFSTSL